MKQVMHSRRLCMATRLGAHVLTDETLHESPKRAFCTTSFAISPATCVKRGTPAAQSPMA